MQKESTTQQSKLIWLAVAILIVLTAGYAMIPSHKAVDQTPSKSTAAEPLVGPPPAPVAVKEEPKASKTKQAPPQVAASQTAPAPAKTEPSEKPSKTKAACNCEVAETELPDICPDASCHQCKVKCGIMTH